MEFDKFIDNYYAKLVETLESFDRSSLEPVLKVFQDVAKNEGTLWIAGNGGSASISDHTVCDATKLTYAEGKPFVRSIALTSNTSMITALANDISYDEVFSCQLKYYLKPNDAVLLVSSSGNSQNIINACEYANSKGIPTIGFVGFEGGKLKTLAKHSVWIPVKNYGITEDIHQSLMHIITQFISAQNSD